MIAAKHAENRATAAIPRTLLPLVSRQPSATSAQEPRFSATR